MTKTFLNELIRKGLSVDIFLAEKNYALYKCIGDNAERIVVHKEFIPFFKNAQRGFSEVFLLAVFRLFDKPNKKHKTSCVLGLLDFLEENIGDLPEIVNRSDLYGQLITCGFSQKNLETVLSSNVSDNEITKLIVEHYRTIFNSQDVLENLNSLKILRDEHIAHNDLDKSENFTPTYKTTFGLINHAKKLIGTIGWAYLSMPYEANGEYILTEKAESAKYSLLALLDYLDRK